MMASPENLQKKWDEYVGKGELGPAVQPLALKLVRGYEAQAMYDQRKSILETIVGSVNQIYGPDILPWAALLLHEYERLGATEKKEDLDNRVKDYLQQPGQLPDRWQSLCLASSSYLYSRIDMGFNPAVRTEPRPLTSEFTRGDIYHWRESVDLRLYSEDYLPLK
jgi:hypothetical protein